MRWLLLVCLPMAALVFISADIEVGSWLITGHWLTPLPFAYVVFNVTLALCVLYAFTRDQPEPDPIKERGIK